MTDEEIIKPARQFRDADASLDEYDYLFSVLTRAYCQELAKMENIDNGTQIECPKCEKISTVYHFHWEAITCGACSEMIDKRDWKLFQYYAPKEGRKLEYL